MSYTGLDKIKANKTWKKKQKLLLYNWVYKDTLSNNIWKEYQLIRESSEHLKNNEY